MSFIDFCRYFEMAIVCKIRSNWYHYGPFEGRFASSSSNTSSTPASVVDLSQPINNLGTIYELQIDNNHHSNVHFTQTEVTITLYRKESDEEEKEDEKEMKISKFSIFLVVFELLNCKSAPVIGRMVGHSVCNNVQSYVACECELRKGKRYLLGVFGFSQLNPKPNKRLKTVNYYDYNDYVIRMHSSRQIHIDSTIRPNSVLLGDMIMYYVKATGKVIYVSIKQYLGIIQTKTAVILF